MEMRLIAEVVITLIILGIVFGLCIVVVKGHHNKMKDTKEMLSKEEIYEALQSIMNSDSEKTEDVLED